ncbi:MAG: hypothetical protein HYY96_09320 [Candidatus Tectomicrobia bacterium]|nr:hypothetical protein [Candidatus Tectomicrobia bacterium]
MSQSDYSIFKRLFPGCRIISRSRADYELEKVLASYPHCLNFRRNNTYALKLFDFFYFSSTNNYIMLDSDVLFFDPSKARTKLADIVRNGTQNVFTRDYQHAYFLSQDALEQLAGKPIRENINVGFALVRRSSIELSVIEGILERLPLLLQNTPWPEQTIYALLSASCGIELLGPEYEVAQGFGLEGRVMKHYVAPVRELFYIEGIPAVASLLDRNG